MNPPIDNPAPLPATLALSKSNVRDFIRARGVGIPIIIPGGPMRDFIAAVAAEWQINLVSIKSALLTNCQRAAQSAVKGVLDKYIEEKFPALPDAESNNIPDTLPKYTVENAMIIGAEAAEKAVRPWVLSSAHHTNPNRQAAGQKAAAARTLTETTDAAIPGLPGVTAVSLPMTAAKDPEIVHIAAPTLQEQKTADAVKLADSEFERTVVESKDILATSGIVAEDLVLPQQSITIEDWLTEHSLRTMALDNSSSPWICLVAGISDESISSPAGMKAALRQNLVVSGLSELHACFNYMVKNKLPWPESLAQALDAEANPVTP